MKGPLTNLLSVLTQVTARQQKKEVGKFVITAEVTSRADASEVMTPSAEGGAYVYGLSLQGGGARWNLRDGILEKASSPRQMTYPMPVINLKGVSITGGSGSRPPSQESAALKSRRTDAPMLSTDSKKYNNYACPVYMTEGRGLDHYVFTINLQTKVPSVKWVLAGTALTLDANATSPSLT